MSLPTTMQMNPRFLHALYCMEKTDASVFITGKAGTGKSTLLSHFCATTRKKPVVLAPTGVAALNVKGQTIHKFFNFYIDVTPDKIRRRQIKPRNPKLYKKITAIIFDEVSMVRADLLDCIDAFLRLYGPKDDQPFGGVQMIFVGDLYQLPPVVSAAEPGPQTLPIAHQQASAAAPGMSDVRTFIDAMLERKVIKKVFQRNRSEYESELNKLNGAQNWKVASQILDELFVRINVDPYSRTAIRFTDSVYGRYLSTNNRS